MRLIWLLKIKDNPIISIIPKKFNKTIILFFENVKFIVQNSNNNNHNNSKTWNKIMN